MSINNICRLFYLALVETKGGDMWSTEWAVEYTYATSTGTACPYKGLVNIGKNICLQYIPRNMHTVTALLCFVVVIHWLIFPYPSGLLHWHCGNLTIAPVPAKQPWWIWINTSCEFIINDCITTTKQSTTKPCAYFMGYTVHYDIAIRKRSPHHWPFVMGNPSVTGRNIS